MTSCFPDPGLDFPEAVEMLEAGRLDVSALLTHTVPLAQAPPLPLPSPFRRVARSRCLSTAAPGDVNRMGLRGSNPLSRICLNRRFQIRVEHGFQTHAVDVMTRRRLARVVDPRGLRDGGVLPRRLR